MNQSVWQLPKDPNALEHIQDEEHIKDEEEEGEDTFSSTKFIYWTWKRSDDDPLFLTTTKFLSMLNLSLESPFETEEDPNNGNYAKWLGEQL